MSWRERAKQAVEKNSGGSAPTKPTKPSSVSFGGDHPAPFSPEGGCDKPWGYSAADLDEMDRMLRELAQLEGWSDEEIEARLDERRRMAPVNVRTVRTALESLRKGHSAAIAPWSDPPKERAKVELCVITGGKK